MRILAIASAGGHWIQLRRLAPAWAGEDVFYVTTRADFKRGVMESPAGESTLKFFSIVDASRDSKLKLILQFIQVLILTIRIRPQVVVSTGAAPGVIALRLGKLIRAKTIWLDSIANAEELSLSGKLCRDNADICLTQWPHIAEADKSGKVKFWGAVVE